MLKFFLLLTLLGRAFQPSPEPDIWVEPIPYLFDRVKQNYLAPVSQFGAGHRGIDVVAELDESIASPTTGQIHFVGKVVDRRIVTLKNSKGLLISFEPACSNLTAGDLVLAGSQIGRFCDADQDYREHCENCLHISARDENGYLSPLQLMGYLKPSVLIG